MVAIAPSLALIERHDDTLTPLSPLSPTEAEAARFLRLLRRRLPAGGETWTELRAFPVEPTGRKYRQWVDDAEMAARSVAGLRDSHNIFAGVNPRHHGQGGKAGVTYVACLHADADAKHFDGNLGAAFQAIDTFPLEPSCIVRSGNGYHAYWLLDEPLPATQENVGRAESLMRQLYRRLGGLDGVQDISRVLRLPGSLNHKPETAEREVRVVYESDATYILDDFEAILPAAPEPVAWRQEPAAVYDADYDEPPPIEQVEEMLSLIDPNLPYEDWMRVLMAVHAAYPGQEGFDICDEWSTAAREGSGQRSLRNQPEKWNQFRRDGEEGSIGIGSLYHYARLAGWEPPAGPTLVAARRAPTQDAREPGEWPEPIPFDEHRPPPFPTDALPGWLRLYVNAEAEATQTPPDLAAMVALAALAATVGGKVRVEVKPGYSEPLNLYAVVALPPGNRKSAVFTDITAPLTEWERREGQRLAPIIDEAQARRRIKKAALHKAEQTAGASKPGERAVAEENALALGRELREITVPALPRLIADDASPEKLAGLLSEQGGRLAIMSAEGEVFETMAGRYSSGVPNLNVYLKGHAGDELRVDRVNRPSEFVRRPALTMGLTVQPDVLRGLADKPGFRGRGLLARFLYSLPQSRVGYRDTDARPVEGWNRETYTKNLLSLLQIPDPSPLDGYPQSHLIRLSDGAQQLLRDIEGEIEAELREDGRLGQMVDWGGKLFGAVARIVGLLHLAEHADEATPWAPPVGVETVAAAWRIGEYLVEHATATFTLMGADPAVEDAKRLLRWIGRRVETTGVREFTKSEAQQANKGRFKRATDIDAPLALLIERGFIRPKGQSGRRERPGRPRQGYDINPDWHPEYPGNPGNYPPTGHFQDFQDI